MTPEITLQFMDEVLDLLTSTPTPADILAYQPAPELYEHVEHLMERNRDRTLTDGQRGELDEIRRLLHFIEKVKERARLKVGS